MYQFLSQPSQHHHRDATEVYRHKASSNKITVTENGLYNSTSTIHNVHYSKEITQNFTAA
jgi:hypothetical protein